MHKAHKSYGRDRREVRASKQLRKLDKLARQGQKETQSTSMEEQSDAR